MERSKLVLEIQKCEKVIKPFNYLVLILLLITIWSIFMEPLNIALFSFMILMIVSVFYSIKIKKLMISRKNLEDFDEKFEYRGYDAFPEGENKNIYLSIDENKGGIFTLSLESDEVPKATDFTYSTGSIGTPEGDWDFINQIFFKGQPLTIDDYLDNWGKTSNVEIFTSNGEVIN